MMLSGAAKTQTEKTAQIHPTTEIRLEPFENMNVSSMIDPNAPRLKNMSSFVVYTCKGVNRLLCNASWFKTWSMVMKMNEREGLMERKKELPWHFWLHKPCTIRDIWIQWSSQLNWWWWAWMHHVSWGRRSRATTWHWKVLLNMVWIENLLLISSWKSCRKLALENAKERKHC